MLLLCPFSSWSLCYFPCLVVWGIHLSVVHKVSFIKVYIIWTKTTDNLHLYKIRFITFHATLLMSFINIQILEVVRLEGQALTHDDGLMSRDIHLLQVIILFFRRYLVFKRALLPIAVKKSKLF
mgnify:CR=1 FL=1